MTLEFSSSSLRESRFPSAHGKPPPWHMSISPAPPGFREMETQLESSAPKSAKGEGLVASLWISSDFD